MSSPGQSLEAFQEWLDVASGAVDYPPTPQMAAQVAARLVSEPSRRESRTWRSFELLSRSRPMRGLAAALVVAVLVLGSATAISPTVRFAVASFFGLDDIEVVRVEAPPIVPPSSEVPAGFEAVAGAITLAEARSTADFPIGIPSYPEDLGEPSAVYLQDLQPGQQVVLVYESRPGLGRQPTDENDMLFRVFQFETEGGIFRKVVYPKTLVEELTVGGARALWFEGASHILQYRDAQGNHRIEFERTVEGNTLAWEVGDVTYRLETSLPKAEAVKIAESMR